jgi:hypothetical protein
MRWFGYTVEKMLLQLIWTWVIFGLDYFFFPLPFGADLLPLEFATDRLSFKTACWNLRLTDFIDSFREISVAGGNSNCFAIHAIYGWSAEIVKKLRSTRTYLILAPAAKSASNAVLFAQKLDNWTGVKPETPSLWSRSGRAFKIAAIVAGLPKQDASSRGVLPELRWNR